jgi:hypothetical protein
MQIFKTISVIVLAHILTGCVYHQTTLPDIDRNVSVIHINQVEDVHTTCNEGASTNYPRLIAQYQGCARWSETKTLKSTGREYNTCIVTIGETVNFEVLGHEVMHCFTGNFHGDEPVREELAAR